MPDFMHRKPAQQLPSVESEAKVWLILKQILFQTGLLFLSTTLLLRYQWFAPRINDIIFIQGMSLEMSKCCIFEIFLTLCIRIYMKYFKREFLCGFR